MTGMVCDPANLWIYMLITISYHSKLIVECMYNEQTNAHLIDSFYYTVLYLPLLHVSTPTINMSMFITDCIYGHLKKKS
jgi:hypothetical protein